MISPAVIASGALVGLGVTLVIRELLPSHPDLSSALARLSEAPARRQAEAEPSPPGAVAALRQSLGPWLARHGGDGLFVRVPTRELDLLGSSVEGYWLRKVALGFLGLLFPVALTAATALLGLRLPLILPAGASLALAAGLFLVPDVDVRRRAEDARREFRRAVCAYLDLAALERAADAGPIEALERAAAVGHGWVFARVRDALLRAQLSGTQPWTGLSALAEEIGVPELGDLADIMRLSGEDGAAVYDTLRARARSLRSTILTDHEARANRDSEAMVVPVALLGLVFVGLIGYPAFARILLG